ncbi:MAG: class I tRNA ligase family protein [Patescibacteria group bacterium]|nr:class I tRNA ligase family protein [Patescibacteria group bacterium]
MFKEFKEYKPAELEAKVAEFWRKNRIFEKAVKSRRGRKNFVFYEGPPYANGRPALHHVLARVFKDIVLRYKTMQGYNVPRRAGWDTHGLPIELGVEKELGIKEKREIEERVGIDVFNAKAKENIWKYLEEWNRFTERIGYWIDLNDAYVTYTPEYIESLWWIFKRISDRGHLVEARKIVPYCPRCGTPLSSHELGQPEVYRLTKDPSVYVKFKIKEGEYLLVWTTTPWTLPSNVAVAVNPKLTYKKYKSDGEFLWSALVPPGLSEKNVSAKKPGKELVGLAYEPLYPSPLAEKNDHFYKVVAGDFVSAEDGTGLVHIAPAFGEDDFKLLGKKSFPITVDDRGNVTGDLPGSGKFIKSADKDITSDLKSRGLLHFEAQAEHEYPFCWRCSTPLIYFARSGWFFAVSKLRKELQKENETINWVPEYIKHGRFGEWIKEAVDWSVSRERYWGTPLPIWKCGEGHITVAGGLDDLDRYDYRRNSFYIVRHGEAESNVRDFIASGPEHNGRTSHLTPRGSKQVQSLAKKIAAKKIDVIFTSPYERTRETARIIAENINKGNKEVEIIEDDRLREINAGVFNWRKVAEHKRFFNNPVEEFTKRPEGGENLEDVRKRVLEFLLDVNRRYRGKNILIVGHGDPLWMLEAATSGASNEEALKLSYIDLAELKKLEFHNYPYSELGMIDMHRPYVDRVELECLECGGVARRVPEVADVWYDSGGMPLASVHYPFENREYIDEKGGYPADFIAEGIDQTRGWFYTLLTEAVLLGRKTPYRNVISLGLIRDKYGQKMSKSKGNVVNPWEVMDKYGADVVRWYFYTVNPPAEPKNFDELDLQKTMRRFFLTAYNSYLFYTTIGGGKKKLVPTKNGGKNRLDEWIISRLHEAIGSCTKNLDAYEIGQAAREIEALVDDLSRWYIRRSRGRKESAHTLREVLLGVSKLSAPFSPFFAEALYQSLGGEKQSVHLEEWPEESKKMADKDLVDKMAEVRAAAAAILSKRNEEKIKVRQPLASVSLSSPESGFDKDSELVEILKEEVNVKEAVFNGKIKRGEVILDTNITPELKEEGIIRELGRMIQSLRQKAGLSPKNYITLMVETTGLTRDVAEKNEKQLKKTVNAKTIVFRRGKKFDAESAGEIDETPIWIGFSKVN